MNFLTQLILLTVLSLPLHAQVDRYKKNILTTNDVALGPSITLSNGILDAATSSSASLQTLYYGGQYGFGVSSVTPTNVYSTNLVAGTTDLFTVPTGKRFILSSVNLGTTNLNSTTVYALLKTNGVYYRFGGNSSVLTNATIGVNFGSSDNFLFEPGETVSVNTALDGVNAILTGILFSTNINAYSPRLLVLTGGVDTLYTCPAGKCAVNMTFPHPLGVGSPVMFGTYVNDSGGTRTLKSWMVPSGASADSFHIQYTRTVLDDQTAPVGTSIFFPGDSVMVQPDASTATQWVRMTVVEIPFP